MVATAIQKGLLGILFVNENKLILNIFLVCMWVVSPSVKILNILFFSSKRNQYNVSSTVCKFSSTML
jgi:hypothetical protein